MKFKIRYAEQITGIFILLAILFIALVMILMGINQRWFKNDPRFYSVFESAEGLKMGMSIKLRGFQIGKIQQIELLDNNRVEIRFSIFENYHEKIRENSILQLSINPLGLGGGLLLYPGRDASAPLAEGSYIPSTDFDDGRKLVTAGLVEISETDAVSLLMDDVSTILGNANQTILDLGQTIRTINLSLAGEDPGPFGGTLRNVETITAELASSMGRLTGQLNTTMGNVAALSDQLAQPDRFLKNFVAPDSSIALLLNDKAALYREIEGILAGVNDTIAQLEEFSGYINDSSPQISGLIEDGREALDKGKDVLEGLRNNPLLRGGISERKEQAATYRSYRDKDF